MQLRKALFAIAFAATIAAAACGGAGNGEKAGNVREAEKIAAEGRATGPMPDGAFKAAVTVTDPPTKMRPGEKQTITVKVKNVGNAPWPAHGRSGDGFYQVNLGDIWYDDQNTRIEKHPYVRSPLPGDVRPGEEVEVPLVHPVAHLRAARDLAHEHPHQVGVAPPGAKEDRRHLPKLLPRRLA